MREVLGNVSTMITFNISHIDATMLHQEFAIDMGGKVEYVPPEEFITLKVGEAWGGLDHGVGHPVSFSLSHCSSRWTEGCRRKID
jgi:hypothetical protein